MIYSIVFGGEIRMLLGWIAALSAVSAGLICIGPGNGNLWSLLWGFCGTFLLGLAAAFVFIFVMAQRVDLQKPQEQDDPFYRKMLHLYVDSIILFARVKVIVTGKEKMPADGRILLVANHRDNLDPAFLLTAFREKQLAFISKREVQQMFMVGKLMHKIQCQPINRENDREALKTILECIQIIKEDKASIAVFPEGYIYPDRKLHRFRHGVFKVATKTNVPIAVCTLRGTTDVLPSLKRLKPSTVEIHLVDVIYPEDYAPMTTVELGDRIYDLMAADLGAELVSEE